MEELKLKIKDAVNICMSTLQYYFESFTDQPLELRLSGLASLKNKGAIGK